MCVLCVMCMKSSGSFVAERPVESPQKLFIFVISKTIFWIKVSKKNIWFDSENTGALMTSPQADLTVTLARRAPILYCDWLRQR